MKTYPPSGGENQKVSTARLFAKDFEIAVLDEPSSALDPIAEYKMYENLIDVTKGKTVIFISHRLSSAVLSDNIIVLSNGKIIEQGSHNELMKNGGNMKKCLLFKPQIMKRRVYLMKIKVKQKDEHSMFSNMMFFMSLLFKASPLLVIGELIVGVL